MDASYLLQPSLAVLIPRSTPLPFMSEGDFGSSLSFFISNQHYSHFRIYFQGLPYWSLQFDKRQHKYNHKNKSFWTFISDIRRGWTIRWAKKFPFFSHSWPCATRLIYYHRQWWKPFNLSPASPTKIKGLSKPGGPGGHCVFKWILRGHFKPKPSATI